MATVPAIVCNIKGLTAMVNAAGTPGVFGETLKLSSDTATVSPVPATTPGVLVVTEPAKGITTTVAIPVTLGVFAETLSARGVMFMVTLPPVSTVTVP